MLSVVSAAKKPRLRKIGRRLLALLMGCAVALVLCELVLRIYNPVNARLRGNRIVLPRNVKYIYQSKVVSKVNKTIVHTKNSLGFRGDDPPETFESYLTVIAIGGSTTECKYLSDGGSWPELVGNDLEKHFPDVWLNNAGLDGHSSFGHLVLVQDLVADLKPRYALFLIGANDVGRGELTSSHVLADFKSGVSLGSWKAAALSLCAHSELVSLTVNGCRYAQARWKGLPHVECIEVKTRERLVVSDDYKRTVAQKHAREFVPPYERRLRKLVQSCRSHAIEPILITHPALFGPAVDEVTHVDLGKIRVRDDQNGELAWEVLELYNDVTRRVGAEQGLLVIDLATELPKNSNYYYDFYHYTDEGAAAVARIVAAHLVPFLQERHATVGGS